MLWPLVVMLFSSVFLCCLCFRVLLAPCCIRRVSPSRSILDTVSCWFTKRPELPRQLGAPLVDLTSSELFRVCTLRQQAAVAGFRVPCSASSRTSPQRPPEETLANRMWEKNEEAKMYRLKVE